MRSGNIVRFGSVNPGSGGSTADYYFIDEMGLEILCEIFPDYAQELQDIFGYTYENDGLFYAPANAFRGSELFSVIMGDENLSTFIGFMPFAPSNMPSVIAG